MVDWWVFKNAIVDCAYSSNLCNPFPKTNGAPFCIFGSKTPIKNILYHKSHAKAWGYKVNTYFDRDVTMKYHKLDGLNNRNWLSFSWCIQTIEALSDYWHSWILPYALLLSLCCFCSLFQVLSSTLFLPVVALTEQFIWFHLLSFLIILFNFFFWWLP